MTDFLSIPQHQLRVSGNTAGATASLSSGTVTLAGGNNITLSQAGNAVTISGAAAAGAQTAISGIAASNTTYTSGTVTFTGVGGGITVSSNTGQRIDLSVAAQTTQTQDVLSVGVSTGGNTAGNTTVNTGSRFVIVGSNGITASQGTAAGATTVTLSGITQSVQTQGNLSLGVSTGGNTVGNTTVNTGSRFVLVASGNATASQATAAGASTVTISVGTQTVQTQDVLSVGASNVGNTSGDTTVNTGSRLVFAGGNNVTISQSTAAGATTLTFSGPNVGGAQTGISGIANSQTTYTSGTVSLSELGAITIRSTTGNQFQFSVNSQSVQPETQTFLAGIQNSQTTYTSGTVNLSVVAGNLTIRSTTGQAFQFSASQSVQPETQTAISGIANSQTTYTSGTVSLSELGAITIRSTTGNQYQLSVNAQTTQTQGILSAGVSTGGNTAGNTTVNTGSRLVIVASGNATASQATAAGASTITISVGGGAETQTAISGIANSQTTYTSGTVSWSELGAVTIRSTTGQQYQISVNSQSVQTQGIGSLGVSTGGNTAGNTQVSTGSRIVFAGVGDISLSQATAAGASTISISGSQSVQTQGIGSIGVSTGGNTAGNTTVNTGTRFVLVGSNMISLSQATAAGASTVTINATQSVQTQSLIQALYDGANSITTGTVRLTNANGVSFSINGQTLSGSVNDSISMFAVSNTTQSTTGAVHKSVMSFAGAGIASVGVTGNSVLISVPAGGGAGDGGVFAGASTMGNTAGSTGTVSTGNFVLVGTGPISLSQSTGAAGSAATISIDAPATSSLSGTGNIQISTNGSTISIGDGGEILDFWDNLVPGASTTFQVGNATLNVWPLNPANANFPGFMSVSSIFFDVSGTVSTAASFTRSMSIGFYTRVNSTQLSLASSASTSWGTNAANAAVNDSMGGRRWVTLQSSQFAAGPSFQAGSDYYLAVWQRSSSGSQTFNFLGQLLPYATGIRSGFMSAASATNTTNAHYPFLGNYSVSFTTAMPSALAASDVNASNATAISLPRIIFNNVGSNIV